MDSEDRSSDVLFFSLECYPVSVDNDSRRALTNNTATAPIIDHRAHTIFFLLAQLTAPPHRLQHSVCSPSYRPPAGHHVKTDGKEETRTQASYTDTDTDTVALIIDEKRTPRARRSTIGRRAAAEQTNGPTTQSAQSRSRRSSPSERERPLPLTNTAPPSHH